MSIRETVRLVLVRVVVAKTRQELDEDIVMLVDDLEDAGWAVTNAADADPDLDGAMPRDEDDLVDVDTDDEED